MEAFSIIRHMHTNTYTHAKPCQRNRGFYPQKRPARPSLSPKTSNLLESHLYDPVGHQGFQQGRSGEEALRGKVGADLPLVVLPAPDDVTRGRHRHGVEQRRRNLLIRLDTYIQCTIHRRHKTVTGHKTHLVLIVFFPFSRCCLFE